MQQGHEVEVFTAQPSYNDVKQENCPVRECVGGVRIRRVGLLPEKKTRRLVRIINMFWFLCRAIGDSLIRRDCDVIISNSHPPVLMGIALTFLRAVRGTDFIIHCQDIHPEGAMVAGDIRRGWLSRVLLAIDRFSCQSATKIVTLSEDMKATLVARGNVAADRIQVLNNFSLDVNIGQAREQDHTRERRFRLLFAGNMGRFQALPRLLHALAILKDELAIECHFMGAGTEVTRLKKLTRKLRLPHVRFEEFQEMPLAVEAMQKADLGVVSLADDVYTVAYPSKTMTYLGAGCPVLCLVENESQIAAEVVKHQLGYVPKTLSATGIAASIRFAYQDCSRWTGEERRRLRQRGEQLFGRQQALRAWNSIFLNLSASEKGLSKPTISGRRTAA